MLPCQVQHVIIRHIKRADIRHHLAVFVVDIILRDEFEAMEGLDVLWTVTDDPKSSLLQERIDADFLKRHVPDLDQNFYLCGPDAMVRDLRDLLDAAGADVSNVTWEK